VVIVASACEYLLSNGLADELVSSIVNTVALL